MILFNMRAEEKFIHISTTLVVVVEVFFYAVSLLHVCVFNVGIQKTQGGAVEFCEAGIQGGKG